ncbi:helix-turn-helix transcriptional regulator [Cyanothece sp. BG0011]|uniref:helix-turn-helix domain-containing protein n=1 Tax=Cyanothece sp. BG0011 TaxID=2082950 RepID=UPI000D1D8C98|nr:helix-turn-helix transcriptional regulator [Cyanothece sp. BG0011]
MKTHNDHNDEQTLKGLIAECGLTQREISEKTGIPERTINSWVSGERMPTLARAVTVASCLNCSLKTFAQSLGIDVSRLPDD